MRFPFLLIVLFLCTSATASDPVDFQRDVRPILSNYCYKCHGPATQKAGLRLDSFATATRKNVIVPKSADTSKLLHRITSEDEAEVMPPPDANLKLSAKQIDVLKRWINSGAEYTPHWAFVVPKKPELPTGNFTSKHPIDTFIQAKLQVSKILPSMEADRATLIKRVSLDLVGLLPSPEEVAAFANDTSPNAYEKVVDRLLASPHYGERQARHWLDLARYADSNGFTVDGPRNIWPFRDWVIHALNSDMPFDRFTREQLAGDLLPQATKEQLIATGFHRNTAYNEEGGSDAEQFRVERTIDRTNTTAAVWLGLTFNCAQCHDHKYDPIAQKDYYQLYAFFNSCDEPTHLLDGPPDLQKKVSELTKKADELKGEGKLEEGMKVEGEIKKLKGKIPSTLIMRESKKPRESYVQIRGDFLRKGDKVLPEFPTVLASPEKKRLNRLDLAIWLTSKENPLTSRVVVNRAWQQFFGTGLVETENDFGMQGALPTHPQLLDWLATKFIEEGWSMKKLHKQIVMSHTYRQTSTIRKELQEQDPRNQLLARQSRIRLEAEIIRDSALTASGLLSRKVGGPGVFPPMPSEVFSFTQSKRTWTESKGEDRYRRGMYTYIWRQSQHHLLTTFDGADAQVACTKRNRSNTPLQALHLANDPAFLEFYQSFGKKLEKLEGSDEAKVEAAWKSCFSRAATVAESTKLMEFVKSQPADQKWSNLARVLMNLDEFVTRD